uniref:B2 protein n=1 Tax=Noccaea caerulescens TaxID=107243 RepID=A0A1J3DUM1_NOCCA
MELRNAKEDENEKTLEASVIGNEKTFEASVIGNGGELAVEAEAVETSDEDEKPEEAALKVASVLDTIEDNKTEDGIVEGPSVLASVGASSSGTKKPKALLGKKKVVKKVKKLVKKRISKGTALQVAGGENVTVEQNGEPSSLGGSEKEAKEKDSEPSLGEDDMESKEEFAEAPGGGNLTEAEKAIEGFVGKKQPRRVKAKAKLSSQQMTVAEQNEDKTGLVEGTRRKRRRQGKQVLGSDKKQKKEVVVVVGAAAADVTQQRKEEGKKEETDGNGVAKIGGLIFMCNAKTRPDCFRFSVMGLQEKRKDYVMSIKPGIKLFLYDYDLKLLYGVFQASSAGGMKLERNAFGGSFPAQVRFTVVKDCLPLPESKFKKAIKENYNNNNNKFKTELSRKQVFKLTKLFRPASLPAQLTHTLPVPVPRPDKNHRSYAPGSSRAHPHDRSRNPGRASPPPRREAPPPPHDLFLSEREYRAYGLRRVEPIPHHLDSSYNSVVNRDRLPLDSYHHPTVDHERLLRRIEMERHGRREVRLRDYHHPYDHLSSRLEILSEPPPPAASSVAMESYRRDPYYRYEHRSPERPPPRTYLASSGREEDDLYSRYVTADSLAEYYRSSSSSRRFPSMAEPEFPPSSVTSRYGYSGSLPYSHR